MMLHISGYGINDIIVTVLCMVASAITTKTMLMIILQHVISVVNQDSS